MPIEYTAELQLQHHLAEMNHLLWELEKKIVVHDWKPTTPSDPRQATLLELDPAQAMIVNVVAELQFHSLLSGDPDGSPALESIAEVKRQLLDLHTRQVRALETDLELIERARNR